MPWGPREYFSREEFEADLKRVVAFYRDRGYPDARVRSVRRAPQRRPEVGPSEDRHRGRRTDPRRAGRARPASTRFRKIIAAISKPGCRSRRVQPLDRALLQASREAALDELKDHGYPNPEVKVAESPGSSDRLRRRHLQRRCPGGSPMSDGLRSRARRASTTASCAASSRSGPGSCSSRASCARASAGSIRWSSSTSSTSRPLDVAATASDWRRMRRPIGSRPG